MLKGNRYIEKARAMSFRMLLIKVLKKLKKKIYFTLREHYVKNFGVNINSDDFKEFTPKCDFFIDISQRGMYVEKLKRINKQDEIIKDSEKILGHVFNLLGSGDKYLGKKLTWNKDFKTDFLWSNKFYKKIRIIDLNNNSDVKVPWELSRFQHIFTLGKAYLLTMDEKYSFEFNEEIEDWIKSNPVEMSVNWTCTMDVAIRAVNLIIGYFFFKDSKAISKEFWTKLHKSLYLHGKFIIKNLENEATHRGNHYLSNIVGLIWLGIYFGDFDENSKGWLDFALKELEKEMLLQVNKDGTNYEASTSYHRLVTELFLMTTILCNKNHISFSKEYMVRLERMCEFIMNITKPNNLSPLVGDADDGRLTVVSNYTSWVKSDFTHLLAVAGEYFNRDDFRYYGRNYKEDALWIIGSYKEEEVIKPILKSKAYRSGGYYILRNDRIYCLIRCGELSFRGQGCHSHNDQLSFELNLDGEDFIVDPGAYVYTADYKKRNLFRSTEMHNTLYIEGYEQNHYEKNNLFYMKEETFGQCLYFNDKRFVGRHFGYKDKCGVIHQRVIEIRNNQLQVIDEVIGGSNINSHLNIASNFILDKDVEVLLKEENIELIKNNVKVTFRTSNEKKINHGYISKSYGDIADSKKIEIHNNFRMVGILCLKK